jgi:hypothetical protein
MGMLDGLKRDRADLWIAERCVWWQAEMCVVTFVATRALRLVRWQRTANVVARGSGLAIANGSIYLQVRGKKYLQERATKFYDEARDAKDVVTMKKVVGGEAWQEISQWADACSCLHPFPLARRQQDLACIRRDLENTGQWFEEMKEVVEGWNEPEPATAHQGLVAANLGRTAVFVFILLRIA